VVAGDPGTGLAEVRTGIDKAAIGKAMHDLIADLYPICRSITGDGVRETLLHIGRRIPITLHEVPTGTRAFDWEIPPEWNIRDAWVKDGHGRRVIDFRAHNLHVMSYSEPVRTYLTRDELERRVFTLPDHPQWIPYRTSYYERNWGFCATHDTLASLPDGDYEVCIDSTLEAGSLSYGEVLLEGATEAEVLLSIHICHPSLANDNLSGIALAVLAAEHLQRAQLRYSYRILFIPGTIGSIAWLARNEAEVERVRHGLVLAGVGDPGPHTYKRSRREDATIDRAVEHVLATSGHEHVVLDWSPYGYDERQFCSPGFDLPVGRLSRSPHGEYPEYHTSADDLDFVRPESLAESLSTLLTVLEVLEGDAQYLNRNPKCEPQLGRRSLYRSVGGAVDRRALEMALLWVLSLSDGDWSLLDIARRAGLSFDALREAATVLEQHDLVERLDR
jgi:aminopeptidase-like protein